MPGTYTAGQYEYAAKRIIVSLDVPSGDCKEIVITLNGVAVTCTPSGDERLSELIAAAINSSTVIDPHYNLPIHQLYVAKAGFQPFPPVRFILKVDVYSAPQIGGAPDVGISYTSNGGQGSYMWVARTGYPALQPITITDTIPPGTVLSTTIDGVTVPYTVTAADNQASIATNIAAAIDATTTPTQTNGAPLNQCVSASTTPPRNIPPTAPTSNIVYVAAKTWGPNFTLSVATSTPQENTMLRVNGRFLNDARGNQVILRGINLPLLDASVPGGDYLFPGSDYLNELARSGANAVRIQWYMNYPGGDRGDKNYTTQDLGNFIDRCRAANIIPIVMLGDYTQNSSDMSVLNSTVVPWWTDPAQVSVLQPRANYLILNLCNELGQYRWLNSSQDKEDTYIQAYMQAIPKMRAAGYTMPLMIDAPDGGTSLEVFAARGADLVAADPFRNVLLSSHAYWAAYDGMPYLQQSIAKNLPVVFGEISNKQDGDNDHPYYDIDGSGENGTPLSGFTYQSLLQSLLGDQVGWLAWSWGPDNCAERMLSSNGSFNSLTAFGNDIVYNGTYGLQHTAVRTTP